MWWPPYWLNLFSSRALKCLSNSTNWLVKSWNNYWENLLNPRLQTFCWKINPHTWFKLSICCRFSSSSEFNFCLFHRSQYRLSQACLYMSSKYTFLATTDTQPDKHLGQTEKSWFVNLTRKRKDFNN